VSLQNKKKRGKDGRRRQRNGVFGSSNKVENGFKRREMDQNRISL